MFFARKRFNSPRKTFESDPAGASCASSVDREPWRHPFLTAPNIERFRTYSEQVWDFALKHRARAPRRLNCAFAVNMAQNMYKWAKLAAKFGADATLYLNPQDHSAMSRPEWEEFDGQFADPLDGSGFLAQQAGAEFRIPVVEAPNEGTELWQAYHPQVLPTPTRAFLAKAVEGFSSWTSRLILADRAAVAALHSRSPTVLHRPLVELGGAYPYFRWAEMLARHEVTYIASTPFPAYASGKPYCIFSVGGDMQFDCGRNDDYGKAMRMAFAEARFILATNPHTLGHCRRLGLSNAVYLPYPMDSEHYCPGQGRARMDWSSRFGGTVYVLTTSRIDRDVKGYDGAFFETLRKVALERPEVRYVFIAWGSDAQSFRDRIARLGLQDVFIMLEPAGKLRLIDYYRSCDIVLDQLTYGYYGATGLEAAATGKPIIMQLRAEQYAALYRGDAPPMINAASPDELYRNLLALIDDPERRHHAGTALRQWLVRNHGEQKAVPLLLSLLQVAADRIPVPGDCPNPLLDPEHDDERAYHATCLQSST
jgi:glycosyltransferase involved in cell wall biosynthesis